MNLVESFTLSLSDVVVRACGKHTEQHLAPSSSSPFVEAATPTENDMRAIFRNLCIALFNEMSIPEEDLKLLFATPDELRFPTPPMSLNRKRSSLSPSGGVRRKSSFCEQQQVLARKMSGSMSEPNQLSPSKRKSFVTFPRPPSTSADQQQERPVSRDEARDEAQKERQRRKDKVEKIMARFFGILCEAVAVLLEFSKLHEKSLIVLSAKSFRSLLACSVIYAVMNSPGGEWPKFANFDSTAAAGDNNRNNATEGDSLKDMCFSVAVFTGLTPPQLEHQLWPTFSSEMENQILPLLLDTKLSTNEQQQQNADFDREQEQEKHETSGLLHAKERVAKLAIGMASARGISTPWASLV